MEEKMISFEEVNKVLESSKSIEHAKAQFAKLELGDSLISSIEELREIILGINSSKDTFSWKDDIESKYEIYFCNTYHDPIKGVINQTLEGLFKNTNFKTIDLSGMQIESNGVNMEYMFSGCEQLVEVDLSCLNNIPILFMTGAFSNCKNLEKVDLSKALGSELDSMNEAFSNCTSLKKVLLPESGIPNVIRANRVFLDCISLKEIDMSKFGYKNNEYQRELKGLFSGCVNLESVDLSGLIHCVDIDTGRCNDALDEMFKGCKNLKYLNVSSLHPRYSITCNTIFSGCESLTTENISTKSAEGHEVLAYLITNSEKISKFDEVWNIISNEEKDTVSFNTTSMF